jgi:hypothetical protein
MMYVCLCMYVCTFLCMHACMYACMYLCMHVFMYVCMYVCVYAYVFVFMGLYTFDSCDDASCTRMDCTQFIHAYTLQAHVLTHTLYVSRVVPLIPSGTDALV